MSSTLADHDDFPADDEYRSLSAAAVLALVVGLASPAVFLWPLMVVVPCLAIALAVISLRAIAQTGAAGRNLALVGLALGVFSLAAWGGHAAVFRHRVHAQAQVTAQAMLELLGEGKVKDAYLLSLGAEQRAVTAAYFRAPEEDDSIDPERGDSPQQSVDELLQRPAVVALLEGSPYDSVRLVERGRVAQLAGGRTTVAQVYELTPKQGPARRYAIGLDRPGKLASPPVWRVTGIELTDKQQ